MTDTQPYTEARISIEEIEFDKAGSIYFRGLVDEEEYEMSVDSSSQYFEKFMPPGNFVEDDLWDDHDLLTARMDDYHNLHWLVKESEHIMYRVVRLDELVKEMLYEWSQQIS